MSQQQHVAHGARVGVLDELRLLAALAVVLFHFGFRGRTLGVTEMSLTAREWLLKYGYLGVQMFFVISGFVIAYSAEGRTPLQFGIARFARIYPMFVLCMTITFLIVVGYGAPHLNATTFQWAANLIVKPELLGQQLMDGSYWSISYEIVFYGWVFALMMLGRFKREAYPVIILGWLLISVVDRVFFGSVLMRHLFLTDESGFFCAGLVLYMIFREGYRTRNVVLLVLSVMVAIYQSMELTQWNRVNYGTSYSDLVVSLSCLAIVAIIALAIRRQRSLLPAGLMLALGGISYPLYLLHQHIGYVIFNKVGSAASPEAAVTATVLLLICISYLLWRFADEPSRRLTKSALMRLF
ncbi:MULTISPECIES: acyltransferase family protein [unclassified Rhizobium]|uniref:acyltransferase family protein n=1 Tax=unclassified Rhizobium TaxID=2613769 RepID=UPI0038150FAA